jgi:hypothetical protein
MSTHTTKVQEESGKKKKYQSPILRVYGDIGTLTAAIANKAATADGGTGLTNKTG